MNSTDITDSKDLAANETEDEHWDRVRTRLLASPVARQTFAELAEHHPVRWPSTKGDETLGQYLQFSLSQLRNQRGFGRKRIDVILTLAAELEASLSAIVPAVPAVELETQVTHDPHPLQSGLRRLGIPDALPMSVTFFSARVKDFAEAQGCAGLYAFADYLERNPGLAPLRKRNFGKASFKEIWQFTQALRFGHYDQLRPFLPLDAQARRLDLGVLIRMAAESHDNVTTPALRERLFAGKTLQEVADLTGVTRERVRQVEKLLLAPIAAFLGSYPELHATLWEKWITERCLRDVPSDEPLEVRELAAGAVARIFEESPEGEKQEADVGRSVADLFGLLWNEPAFYVGLNLQEFLDTQAVPPAVRTAFSEEIRQHPRVRFDAASGTLQANNLWAKPFVAALLRRGVTQSLEILDWLKRSTVHASNLHALRRNWTQWKTDPDFPATPITFPTRVEAVAGNAHLQAEAGIVVRGPWTGVQPIPKAPRPVDPELAALDGELTRLINRQTGPVICGLLPVAAEFPARVLAALRRHCAGDVGKLETVLADAPAAAVYGMVATHTGLNGGLAIWEPLATGLGLVIPIQRRVGVLQAFHAALREAGLIDCQKPRDAGEVEDGGGAWSIAAQAGIVPQLVASLTEVLRAELASGPLPDLADETSLHDFALRLARRLPARRRLHQLLASAVGAAVCRLVLGAVRGGNLDELPAAWREHFRAALAQRAPVQTGEIRPPTLGFSPELGLYYELPAQSEAIRRANSYWQVHGTTTRYPIDETIRVPAAGLPAGPLTITLEQLQLDQTETAEFELSTGPSVDEPVLIFARPGGRWIRHAVAADGSVELMVGRDYFLVLAEEAESDLAEESWSVTEQGLRWLSYNSVWNQVPVLVSAGPVSRRIFPRRGVSLLLQAGASGIRLLTTDGHLVHAGDSLEGGLVFAESGGAALGPTRLDVPELGLVGLELVAQPTENAERACYAALPTEVGREIGALAPGIHVLTFVVQGVRRTPRQTVYFWKGLRHISPDDGFVCRGFANIDLKKLEGLRPLASGLGFEPEYRCAAVGITLLHPAVHLLLARPGLSTELLAGDAPASGIALGSTLRVRADDQQIVRFTANLSAPGTVLVEGRPWKQFGVGAGMHATRLISLIPPGASIATITFEQVAGRPIRLFRVVRDRVVTQTWFSNDPAHDYYYVRLGLGREDTDRGALALRAYDLVAASPEEGAIVPFPSVEGTHEVEGDGGIKFSVLVKAHAHERTVELFISREQFAGRFVVMEFVCPAPDGQWEPLMATSGHEAGVVRWVTHTGGIPTNVPLARLLAPTEKREELAEAAWSAPEWADALARLRPLIHDSYAHPFWDCLKPVKQGYLTLGRGAAPAELARAAVFDLARQSGVEDVRFRPILFASQNELVAAPARLFLLSSYPAGAIGRCFEIAGQLGKLGSVTEVLNGPASGAMEIWPIATLMAQAGKPGSPMAAGGFLTELDRVLRNAPTNEGSATPVFSAANWGQAVRQIRRRIERLRRSVAGGGESPQLSALRRFARLRHRACGRIDDLLGVHASRLNCAELSFDEATCEVISLTLLVTAAGRLAAHGHLKREDFLTLMTELFRDTGKVQDSVSSGHALLLHFAPELYASFFLLWEFAGHLTPPVSPHARH